MIRILAFTAIFCKCAIAIDTCNTEIPNYNSQSMTLSVPSFSIDNSSFLKDGIVELNTIDGTWRLIDFAKDNKLPQTNSFILQSNINSFNGLRKNWLIWLSNGLMWQVDNLEQQIIPVNTSASNIVILKNSVNDYILSIYYTTIKVNPFLYSNREYFINLNFINGSDSTIFQADNRIYRNIGNLTLPSNLVNFSAYIFDNKYMYLDGKTYEVQLID